MINRKGELNKRAVDTGWPYQVALPADACTGVRFDLVHDFCRGLSLCPRGHYFRRDDVGYFKSRTYSSWVSHRSLSARGQAQ